MSYLAIINTPGYLSEQDELPEFETIREAWQYLLSEVDRSWDDYPDDENGAHIEAHTQMRNINQNEVGTVYAPTPGDRMYDLGVAYSVVESEGN